MSTEEKCSRLGPFLLAVVVSEGVERVVVAEVEVAGMVVGGDGGGAARFGSPIRYGLSYVGHVDLLRRSVVQVYRKVSVRVALLPQRHGAGDGSARYLSRDNMGGRCRAHRSPTGQLSRVAGMSPRRGGAVAGR